MPKRLTLMLTAFLVCLPAFGWHETGHKATASIAFDQLSEQRQLDLFRILTSHPRFDEDFRAQMPAEISSGPRLVRARWALEQASVWPDIVRSGTDDVRTQFHRSRWHYINLPVWLTASDERELDGKLTHNQSRAFLPPLRQNLNAIQALRGNLQTWQDPATSDADKAVALCWILHITGDLHQPLHTVALFSEAWFPEGDRGGNSIEVVRTPENTNLHAFWDGLPTGMDDLTPSASTVQSISDDVVDNAAIDEWAEQHARLAERFVYSDDVKVQLTRRLSSQQSPLVSLDHNYRVAALAIARRQVNLAGHRMARLID